MKMCLVICSKFRINYVHEPLKTRTQRRIYADVDEGEEYGNRTDYDDTLKQYYSKKGKPVPNWRVSKNPQWWVIA